MRIGLFEQQMTRIIPSFAGFTEFTSSIPKLYWDVKSQEQRILAICKLLNKVICYADMLGENVDEIAHTMQEILDGKLDPMIIAAIAEWFENNQPEILQDIDAINAKIGEGFDADNTVADAIDAVADSVTVTNNIIGEGFSAQNTVANAIDAVADSVTATNDIIGSGFDSENTVTKAVGDIRKEMLFKNVAFPAFEIADRFIIDETPNTATTTGGQVGILFKQGNTVYSATMINKNNSGACDTIRIRNVNADILVYDYAISLCHGLALDYNEDTQQLLWYDENAQTIYLLDVSTPSAPVANGLISTVGTNMQWGVTWYGNNFLMYYVDNGNHMVEIRDSSMTLKRRIALDLNVQSFIYQDITCIGNILVICGSFPEMLIFVDLDTGKQINVLNIDRHYGHVIVTEIEGVSHYDNVISFSSVINVDQVMVVTLFKWNYVDGNSKADESLHLWGASEIVGTLLVDYDTGSLRDPIGDNTRTFKLAGDAENFAKMNYPDQASAITFKNDYPLSIYMSAFCATIGLEGHSYPEGMKFDYMPQLFLNIDAGCEVGKAITFNHANVHLRGVDNLSAITGYNGNLFDANDCTIDSNRTIDKMAAQYTRLIAPNKPTNSTAWKCFYETPIDNWN